jgi:hypothetical protein
MEAKIGQHMIAHIFPGCEQACFDNELTLNLDILVLDFLDEMANFLRQIVKV